MVRAVKLVFLDCETTGVHRGYRAWEIAMIRREPAGSESAITIFVAVEDLDLPHASAEGLAIGGFDTRHPEFGAPLGPGEIHVSEREAAHLVRKWTDRALVFGVNPSYDTVCLDGLLARHGIASTWYYAPQDICAMGYGYVLKGNPDPPRSSEALSRACGVAPPAPEERHTAMGDARWVRRWYDQLHQRQVAA